MMPETPKQVIDKMIGRMTNKPRTVGIIKNKTIILKPKPYKPLTHKEVDQMNAAIWQIADRIPKCSE